MTKAQTWIPLLNYSSKFGISLSTLRRRIKAKTIHYKLEHGKYLLLDGEGEPESPPAHAGHTAPASASPNPPPAKIRNEKGATLEANVNAAPSSQRPAVSFHHELPTHTFVEASVLSSANRLVEEIKAAYAKILQEKEEQISLLKEETVDLRMLVKILEENSKRNLDEAMALRQKIVAQNAESLEPAAQPSPRGHANYFGENETGAQTAPPSEVDNNFENFLFENFQSRDV